MMSSCALTEFGSDRAVDRLTAPDGITVEGSMTPYEMIEADLVYGMEAAGESPRADHLKGDHPREERLILA